MPSKLDKMTYFRKSEYDYFKDDIMKEEEQNFSKYCESILNRVSLQNDKFSSDYFSSSDKDSLSNYTPSVNNSQPNKKKRRKSQKRLTGKFMQTQSYKKEHPNTKLELTTINDQFVFLNNLNNDTDFSITKECNLITQLKHKGQLSECGSRRKNGPHDTRSKLKKQYSIEVEKW